MITRSIERCFNRNLSLTPSSASSLDASRAAGAAVNGDAGVLEQSCRVLLFDQVERAKGESGLGIVMPAVGKQMHLCLLERCGRLGARQHGGREMGGRRHDVGGDKRAFHHRAVDRRVIAAAAAVAREDGMVGRGDERARAAGKNHRREAA